MLPQRVTKLQLAVGIVLTTHIDRVEFGVPLVFKGQPPSQNEVDTDRTIIKGYYHQPRAKGVKDNCTYLIIPGGARIVKNM